MIKVLQLNCVIIIVLNINKYHYIHDILVSRIEIKTYYVLRLPGNNCLNLDVYVTHAPVYKYF